MPFYTQVLSQQSPTTVYHIENERIILIPAEPIIKEFGNGGSIRYVSINFFTNCRTTRVGKNHSTPTRYVPNSSGVNFVSLSLEKI
jgi:hypothetical protein